MVKEIVVLREGGIPLFQYSTSNSQKIDELVSAFLSAIGLLVEQTSEEQLKTMTFAESKIVWVKKGDLYFIALVSLEDSAEIYRVILAELANEFVSRFYSELRKEAPNLKTLKTFIDNVEATLQKFNGIPALARRFKTALLPVEILRDIKLALLEVEANPEIHRGGVITRDGYIIVSNLRVYELEAALDLQKSLSERRLDSDDAGILSHTSLDPRTSFYLINLKDDTLCIFVVQSELDRDKYWSLVEPFISQLKRVDLSGARRLSPKHEDDTVEFSDYDIIVSAIPAEATHDSSGVLFSDISGSVKDNAMLVIQFLDGMLKVGEIAEKTGLSKQDLDKALATLIMRGYIRITKAYPILDKKEDRFATYLEVIGIPKKDYDIANIIWEYCDGKNSIREIAEKSDIPSNRIMEVLRKLGSQVKWRNTRNPV